MIELIIQIIKLIVLIITTFFYKQKLEFEKKKKYDEAIKKQLKLTIDAITKIHTNAKADYDLSVDDEQDEDLKDKT